MHDPEGRWAGAFGHTMRRATRTTARWTGGWRKEDGLVMVDRRVRWFDDRELIDALDDAGAYADSRPLRALGHEATMERRVWVVPLADHRALDAIHRATPGPTRPRRWRCNYSSDERFTERLVFRRHDEPGAVLLDLGTDSEVSRIVVAGPQGRYAVACGPTRDCPWDEECRPVNVGASRRWFSARWVRVSRPPGCADVAPITVALLGGAQRPPPRDAHGATELRIHVDRPPARRLARTMRPAHGGRGRQRERATPRRHGVDMDVDDPVAEAVVTHDVPIRRPVLLWHHVRPVLRAVPAQWVVV